MTHHNNMFSDCETPREAIFQALGAASVCWENPGGAGLFESDRAKQVGDDLIETLMDLFDKGLGWE